MKFQNSSIHGFKVMLCIKKRDERTEGRTDGRTKNPEAICPSNFFEVGGIITGEAPWLPLWEGETPLILFPSILQPPISRGLRRSSRIQCPPSGTSPDSVGLDRRL